MADAVEKAVEAARMEAHTRFGVEVEAEAGRRLADFLGELLRWNRRFNLTSIEDPAQVGELHLLDSLAIVPEIPQGSRVLDVGTGGGFPGVPLAIARPDVEVHAVDRTEKKVLFLQTIGARLGLGNVKPLHRRLEGRREAEGLPLFDVAVSRAFTAPPAWLELARSYVRPGGRVICMVGQERPDPEEWKRALGSDQVLTDRSYQLPSGARRGLIVVQIGEASTAG